MICHLIFCLSIVLELSFTAEIWQVKTQPAPPMLPFIKELNWKEKMLSRITQNKTHFSAYIVELSMFFFLNLFSSFLSPGSLLKLHSFPILKRPLLELAGVKTNVSSASSCVPFHCLRPCAYKPGKLPPKATVAHTPPNPTAGEGFTALLDIYTIALDGVEHLRPPETLSSSSNASVTWLSHFLWGPSPRSSPRPSGFSLRDWFGLCHSPGALIRGSTRGFVRSKNTLPAVLQDTYENSSSADVNLFLFSICKCDF